MDLLMFLAADYAAVDASGKLNILGAFRVIYAKNFPVAHQLMHVVVKLRPALGEHNDARRLRLILVDEDGQEVFHLAQDFRIPKATGGSIPEFNAVIGIRDLQFKKPGRYEFRVYVDKEQKGDLAIDVVQLSGE